MALGPQLFSYAGLHALELLHVLKGGHDAHDLAVDDDGHAFVTMLMLLTV
jgi:hypothetical protein